MTVNAIIEQLYLSTELDDCICKTVRQDHREDFKQELILKIYDIPGKRLRDLWSRNELKYYVVRTIINLVKNKHKSYHKQYLDPSVTYDTDKVDQLNKCEEIECFEERMAFEERELKTLFEIDVMDERFNTPYYKLLVYLLKDKGSMRAVSRLTGIPVSSISEAVKKIRNHLQVIYNGEPVAGIY